MSNGNIRILNTSASLRIIGGIELGRLLRGTKEFALIDLRDEAQFKSGAPLYGNNIRIDLLAREASRLIPHRNTTIALVDADGGRIREASEILDDAGYRNIFGLEGGLDGNERLPVLPIRIAGARVISGEIERAFHTPVTTPRELSAERDAGRPVVVFDTRSFEEYERSHVPSSIPAPGGEILAFYHRFVTSPETHVVVTCAGRSRAVPGAQTLIDAGIPNRVSQLDFGTNGWRDEGFELDTGFDGPIEKLSAEDIAYARKAAQPLLASINRIDHEILEGWLSDESRTTYSLDVRLPDEFARSSLPHSISAPGGQLGIQIGKWVAVQGARLVLIDDVDGFRAATTAHWFKRIGWEVNILLHDFK
ncbi:rhodanese-like domain-containing protein [Rhizobium rhizogenes]|uniref:rhodanese-like domain-containing protein n=1 Tax=Rhizobium rhizogenes TaxID=359 RepID=UPI0015728AB8|nr:rhodanese-like domain-containing protein [Rhizobium rhizogenes]NTI78659.1 thiosulfate sulfurtransferase [Rhizobium rhizogenes]